MSYPFLANPYVVVGIKDLNNGPNSFVIFGPFSGYKQASDWVATTYELGDCLMARIELLSEAHND